VIRVKPNLTTKTQRHKDRERVFTRWLLIILCLDFTEIAEVLTVLLLNCDKTINESVLPAILSLVDNNELLLLNSLDGVIVVLDPDKFQDL
jgi:abortive infection bacteriophage resistance protein